MSFFAEALTLGLINHLVTDSLIPNDDRYVEILPVTCLYKKGHARPGQVRSDQARSGQARSGQVRSGQVSSGKVRSIQFKSGQIRSSHVRQGQFKLN